MAVTLDSARSSTSCAPYQSPGSVYQPSRFSSDRRYVLDSGGRPNGRPGSALMITTGPPKPSSRKVAAAVPPALPPPMITIGLVPVVSAMCYILPQSRLGARRRPGGWLTPCRCAPGRRCWCNGSGGVIEGSSCYDGATATLCPGLDDSMRAPAGSRSGCADVRGG